MKDTRHRQVIFYTSLCIILIAVTLLGLIYYVKTVALNTEIQALKKQYHALRDENKHLEQYLETTLSLENIDHIATERYALKPPKKIHFFSNKDTSN